MKKKNLFNGNSHYQGSGGSVAKEEDLVRFQVRVPQLQSYHWGAAWRTCLPVAFERCYWSDLCVPVLPPPPPVTPRSLKSAKVNCSKQRGLLMKTRGTSAVIAVIFLKTGPIFSFCVQLDSAQLFVQFDSNKRTSSTVFPHLTYLALCVYAGCCRQFHRWHRLHN